MRGNSIRLCTAAPTREEAHELGRELDPRFVKEFYELLRLSHELAYKLKQSALRINELRRSPLPEAELRVNGLRRDLHETAYYMERSFEILVAALIGKYDKQSCAKVLLFLYAFGYELVVTL